MMVSREYPVMNNTFASGWRAFTSSASRAPFIPGNTRSRQKQIHPQISAIDQCERRIRVMRFQDPVVQLAKNFDHIGSDIVIILDEQDRGGVISAK